MQVRPDRSLSGTAVLLIGGTSHVGKSTLAAALAGRLGWPAESTDQMSRHPGRPWSAVRRQFVHEHFVTRDVEELTRCQLQHYRQVWTLVENRVRACVADGSGLVLEGSGIWPDWLGTLPTSRIATCWLTADHDLLGERIRRSSRYPDLPAPQRLAVDRFVGRTLRYDQIMVEAVQRHGLPLLRLGDGRPIDELTERVAELV